MTKAILILGSSLRPDGSPSPAMRRRVHKGGELFLGGGYDRVLVSGGILTAPVPEADVMAVLLRDQGVPERAILREAQSKNTWQNIALCKPLLEAGGYSQVALVTDYYHLPRALLTARRHGLNVKGVYPTKGFGQTPLHRHIWAIIRELAALPVYLVTRQR